MFVTFVEVYTLTDCNIFLFSYPRRRMAIKSARKDGGDTEWFQFGNYQINESYHLKHSVFV